MKKFLSVLSLMAFILAAASVYAADGEAIFKSSCAACHGAHGDKVSPVLGDQTPDEIVTKLKGYADGTFGGSKKAIMEGVAKRHNEEEYRSIAEYIGKK